MQSNHHSAENHEDKLKLKTNCRGFVTADVLVKGLSRGAIASGLLEGVKADTKDTGVLY